MSVLTMKRRADGGRQKADNGALAKRPPGQSLSWQQWRSGVEGFLQRRGVKRRVRQTGEPLNMYRAGFMPSHAAIELIGPDEGDGQTLPALAHRIREQHDQCVSGVCESVRAAVAAGRMLNQVKDRLRHGDYLRWVEANLPEIGERTAQIYVQCYESQTTIRRMIQKNRNAVSGLSLRKLIAEIRADRQEVTVRRLTPLPALDEGTTTRPALPALPAADAREQRFVDSHTRKPTPLPLNPEPRTLAPAPPPPPPPINERTPQWIAGQIVLHTPKPALVYVILELLGCLNRVELNTLYAAVARQQAKVK